MSVNVLSESATCLHVFCLYHLHVCKCLLSVISVSVSALSVLSLGNWRSIKCSWSRTFTEHLLLQRSIQYSALLSTVHQLQILLILPQCRCWFFSSLLTWLLKHTLFEVQIRIFGIFLVHQSCSLEGKEARLRDCVISPAADGKLTLSRVLGTPVTLENQNHKFRSLPCFPYLTEALEWSFLQVPIPRYPSHGPGSQGSPMLGASFAAEKGWGQSP